jgi:pimeloyl-ACP methyl ester carboxylesterase
MAYLDRDGVRIHYEATGSGPAVLLTHGFAASSRMFASNVDALAKDHTVVTWDLRGHGGSDYPEDPAAYSAALTLEDMAALLDTAGADRAVLVGHSLGGYLSLEFHVRYPERVAGLVLVGTGPGFRNDEARDGWNHFAANYSVRLRERALDALVKSEELTPGEHRDASGLERAARGMLVQNDARVMDSLPTIAVPTLVVVGSDDAMFLGGSQYMARKVPGASLEQVEGARHAPNVSHPELFNERVGSFLEGIDNSVDHRG